MNQILYINIHSINRYLQLTAESEFWNLSMSGYFERSQNYVSDQSNELLVGEFIYDLQNTTVLLTAKTRRPRSELPGISAEQPWRSNDDLRDAIRVDFGPDKTASYANVSLALAQIDIDTICSIDLQKYSVSLSVKFRDDDNDPRPLKELAQDHFFAYIEETTIHIVSKKPKAEECGMAVAQPNQGFVAAENILNSISDSLNSILAAQTSGQNLIRRGLIAISVLLLSLIISRI